MKLLCVHLECRSQPEDRNQNLRRINSMNLRLNLIDTLPPTILPIVNFHICLQAHFQHWRQYSIQLYIILYSIVVFCYVCCLQHDGGSVCCRRSRNPGYWNGDDSLHFDSSWDSCEGCFPFAGYRMVAVSWRNVFDVIATLALPETSRKEAVCKGADKPCFLSSLYFVSFRDRCNGTVNVLGDCVGVALVQHLSRQELQKMDELGIHHPRWSFNLCFWWIWRNIKKNRSL